jgi:hypothetical protein
MSASERPAPATGTGPSEVLAAAKPLELFAAHSSVKADDSVGSQLRRRRAASLRCESLADGRLDTLELAERRDPLSSARRLHVEKGPRHTAWLYGGRLKQLCEHANVPHLYDHSLKTWRISARRVDDLIVYAEHIEGRFVTVETVDR